MTHRTSRVALGALLAALVLVPAAAAHVEIAPDAAPAGFEGRFAIQVPNEEADASTVKVVVKFPEEVPVASFQPVQGWTRTVKTVKLATPITDDDGNQVSERIDTVTWEGGEIKPGEFQEFGMSFALPGDAGTLVFPATQTYSNGDVVRWIGPEDADDPAPRLTVEASGDTTTSSSGDTGTTGGGSTGSTGAEEPATTSTTAAEAASAEGDDDSEGRATLALVIAITGLVAGLAALGWVLYRTRKS
jgi:uncharacterized protein YcnI